MNWKMQVSERLQHEFFYLDSLTPADFFPEENRFYLGIDESIPWKNEKEAVIQIVHEWQPYLKELTGLFKERKNKETKPLMVKGISLFIRLLFWSNNEPTDLKNLQEKLVLFEAKPVNIVERLQFLMQRPTLYHSFIQLSELMIEQEKIFYKYMVMKKRVNRT
ncbi:YpoC family protein [Caldifermentibacillus hisashii]|uniref:YpoC family protein n=1 Tax=Caldifermentibacillus hisashii TaxID=996558 RepID=UPI0022B974AF|nr:hypothetical protein [Caldifermentibacillus hisashii]